MQKTPLTLCNHSLTAVLAAVLLAWSSSLHAQTWDGGGTDASWRTAGNWVGDTLPTYGSTANITFSSSANLNSGINTFLGAGAATQIQNLNFGADVDSALGITLSTEVNNLADARLTFQNTTLNTITVDAGASGNITIGNPINDTTSLPASPASSVQMLGNLAINHNGTGILTINRPIPSTGAFSITKTGAGTWQQQGNVLLTGALNVNGGRLIDATYSTAGSFNSVSAINLGGGAIQYDNVSGVAGRTITQAFNVTANSAVAFNNLDPTSKQLVFNTGTTTISSGATLTLQTISANKTQENLINYNRTVTGAGSVAVEGFNNINSGTANFTLGRVAFGGSLSGLSGNLEVRKGTVELYGTAPTAVNTGRFILGETGNSFGAGLIITPTGSNTFTYNNDIIVRSGGFRTIRNSYNDTFYNYNGSVTLEGDLNLHVNAPSSDRRVQLNGNISGVGGLDFTRGTVNGHFRLAGINTYSGATTLNANADVYLQSATGIGDSSAVTLAGAGSILRLNATGGGTETVGSIASSGAFGTIALNNSVLITGGNGANTTYGGVITGTSTSGLTKVGSGTMTLSGANTSLLGRTIVNGGTLTVNGSLGGGVDVSSGSLLKGSGTIAGASTVNGTLSAGNSPGQMTFSSDLTLGTGSNLVWELFGNTSSDVSMYDRITVGGSLLASSGSGITLDFGTTAGGSTVDWSNAFWDTAQTWTFLTVAGTTTGFSNLNLSNTSFLDASGNSLATARSGSSFSITQSGNDVAISYVPEPSTGSLLLIGLASWALVRATRRTA